MTLAAEGLTRIAGKRRIVDSVSARFDPGRVHFILGANGAGKSTLLRMLAAQLRPDSGKVLYGALDARAMGFASLARVRAVLSQNVELAFSLPVREVVMMGRYPHFSGVPSPDDVRAATEVMTLFDLAGMADRDFLTLSGGEQQRVHFARVLAQIWFPRQGAARYLFLDEPLTFLDLHHQLEFLQKLREFAQQPDLVLVGVVHDLNLASRYGDRLLLLHEGRLIADGTPAEVLTPANVEKAFRVTSQTARTAQGQPLLWFDL